MTGIEKLGSQKREEEEVEDYMTMSIPEMSNHVPETSLQRRQRLQREAERRARVKSKAELAAEEEEARERALRTSLLEAAVRRGGQGPGSKGLAMMARMGFSGGPLGKRAAVETTTTAEAQPAQSAAPTGGDERALNIPLTEPIPISVKVDRGGIGLESEKKRKLQEAAEKEENQMKKSKVNEGEYRDRMRREREIARLERQVRAAQKVAERMDEEEEGHDDASKGDKDVACGTKSSEGTVWSSRLLKSYNVLYRGLVRERQTAERDRRMRHELEYNLLKLPTYDDPDEDDEDRQALGRTGPTATEKDLAPEDMDEEDPELDAFDSLEPQERLRRLVLYLRERHWYCFWCKFAYPDATLEGCPGITEEDHD
ncbi:hypothetical protein VTK73DRAFT_1226 [Phialemonium thermophilum]|uniref:DUF4187 domain-containing protein n=1 Tax=Phialemonium thermophilum TaxID=223376 RepID=A0ABR3Y333_9PEZI